MIFVSVNPDSVYFHWQVRVYLVNFLRLGIKPEQIQPVFLVEGEPSEGLKELAREFPVKFFYYPLEERSVYPATNIFRGLKNHVKEMIGQKVFFHDADIVFLRKPCFVCLEKAPPDIWYGSNCRGYTGAGYIKKRSVTVFKELCRIVGVSPALVESMDEPNRVVGAQWIIEAMTKSFWEKCQRDALEIWRYLKVYNNNQPLEKQIQKTGMMWSMLWNVWAAGIQTEVRPELSFTFASSNIQTCNKVSILHNAGVTRAHTGVFSKLLFTKESPIGKDLSGFDRTKSAWKYVEEIENAKLWLGSK